MSRRREVQTRLRRLGEIGEIMRSMKNLALMETRKLGRYAEAQRQGIAFIEKLAADFLYHYPQAVPEQGESTPVLLLIGSERGFCGEFNEQLIQILGGGMRAHEGGATDQHIVPPILVAVGGKLYDRLRDHGYDPISVDGATVSEDLPDVVNRLAETLADLQRRHARLNLQALVHREGHDAPSRKGLLPPFVDLPAHAGSTSIAPLLYLAPERFYEELVQHYLGAVLAEMLHIALLAENEQRVRHLEGAIQRLDEKTGELDRRSQVLRQEEITEEIEIILLSVEGIRR